MLKVVSTIFDDMVDIKSLDPNNQEKSRKVRIYRKILLFTTLNTWWSETLAAQ